MTKATTEVAPVVPSSEKTRPEIFTPTCAPPKSQQLFPEASKLVPFVASILGGCPQALESATFVLLTKRLPETLSAQDVDAIDERSSMRVPSAWPLKTIFWNW